ncbi:AAA family ATPase [Abyssisolibacter fermentans]|uniref:AAA family ATPase n=1 Tax=Abyssisolibacter fermentans TaxID=1766203 RepID=UPI00082AEDDA|nr:AAA family ATPase [Abyssisolibacter fermentans]
MKIISFEGKNIHGFMNVEINFNEDLSLIIGGNGSGKTTALRLIQSIITPSFEELMKTRFDFICLTISHHNKMHTIKCKKDKKDLVLSVDSITESLCVDNLEFDELEYISNNSESKFIEKIKEYPLEYRKHPVIEFIVDIPSPIFLGLERRFELRDFNNEYRYQRNIVYYRDSFSKSMKNRRLYEGTLNSGLIDAQYLIQETYKKVKKNDEYNLSMLREKLLLSSFKFREFDINEFTNSLNNWKQKKDLLGKKEEILDNIRKIEGNKKTLSKELEIFFERLETLLEQDIDSRDTTNIDLELIINMSQIDKIFELIEIVDNHKNKTDKMFSKFTTFLSIINEFYKDSDKRIELDTLGQLKVTRANCKSCSVNTLSSGERQLLVIFAHALFNFSSRNKVFIIDEPELSLHIRWQQIFVRSIMDNCPETQFIMATHSPDIVDEYDLNIIKNWRK